jgi:hypothetical protein
MSTYARTLGEFERYLNLTLQYVGKNQLGVGVETEVDEAFSDRVDILLREELPLLCIWKSPIPNDWIGSVEKFCKAASTSLA